MAVYTSDITDNEFDKGLINYAINKELGFEDDFLENNSLNKWFENNNIVDIEKTFDLMTSKARNFINNFNKFYDRELKKNKDFDYFNKEICF